MGKPGKKKKHKKCGTKIWIDIYNKPTDSKRYVPFTFLHSELNTKKVKRKASTTFVNLLRYLKFSDYCHIYYIENVVGYNQKIQKN